MMKLGAKPVEAPEAPPLKNTGPDLAGQLRSEARAAGAPPEADSDTMEDPIHREAMRAMTPGDKMTDEQKREMAHEWAKFAAGMIVPGLAGKLGGKALAGSVARSAAREPGAVLDAIKAIPRAAVAHHGMESMAMEGMTHLMGLPHGTGAALRVAPSAIRAAGIAADEGAAAVGRAVGYKPYSAVPSRLPANDTGGVPEAVSPETTRQVANEYVGPEAEAKIAEQAARPQRKAPPPPPDETVTRRFAAPKAGETPAAPAADKAPSAHPYVSTGIPRAMAALSPKELSSLADAADRSIEAGRRSQLSEFFDQGRLSNREVRSAANDEIGIKQKLRNSTSKLDPTEEATSVSGTPSPRKTSDEIFADWKRTQPERDAIRDAKIGRSKNISRISGLTKQGEKDGWSVKRLAREISDMADAAE